MNPGSVSSSSVSGVSSAHSAGGVGGHSGVNMAASASPMFPSQDNDSFSNRYWFHKVGSNELR